MLVFDSQQMNDVLGNLLVQFGCNWFSTNNSSDLFGGMFGFGLLVPKRNPVHDPGVGRPMRLLDETGKSKDLENE